MNNNKKFADIFYPSIVFLIILYASWWYRGMHQQQRSHLQNVPSVIGYSVLAAIALSFYVVKRQKIDMYALITVFLYIFLAIYFITAKVRSAGKSKK